MTEKSKAYQVGETVHVNAFLSVPGAEVIIRTPDEKKVEIETLIAVFSRVAAVDRVGKLNTG